MPIDRNAKLTTKWILIHRPKYLLCSVHGWFEFGIELREGIGRCELHVLRLSRGSRQVDIVVRDRFDKESTLTYARIPLSRVSTAGELIDLYNQLSATPWPGTEGTP